MTLIVLIIVVSNVSGSKSDTARHKITAVSKTGLVGYWTFDDNDLNGTTIYDKSGNGNHGTLHNGVTTGQTGKLREAFSFDGEDDYVDCGNDESLDITDAITIEAWVYRKADSGTWERIAAKSDSTLYDYWLQIADDDTFGGGFADTSGTWHNTLDVSISGTPIPLNQWVHLVFVYDGAYVKGYVNGQLDESDNIGSFTIRTSTRSVWIGRLINSYKFNGLIDEVRIYNRALSAEEVLNNYNSGTKRHKITAVSKTGLVGYWTFDDNDLNGTTIYDKSGNGNNGTLGDGVTATSSPTTGQTGKLREAFSFDGVDDYVNIPGNFLSSSMTVEGWIKPNAINSENFQYWISSLRYSNPDHDGFRLSAFNGKLSYGLYTNQYANAFGSYSTTENRWYHVVFVVKPDSVYLYVDGVLRDYDTGLNVIFDRQPPDLDIGRYNYVDNEYFNGLIDEVRIYERALSADEVLNNYNATKRHYIY
ncbi:MAG: LamG domain-containing protein [Candidatus Helarchaeota archaeon]